MISSTVRKAGPFTGDGSTVEFPFTFKVFSSADLEVIKLEIDADVETTLVLTTDYTVTLNADQNSNPGGVVTTVAALTSAYRLTITSAVASTQPVDLSNQGGFYPRVINDEFDRLTILIQQLQDQTARALLIPISEPAGVNPLLPSPEPETLIGWNVLGTGLTNYTRTSAGGSPAWSDIAENPFLSTSVSINTDTVLDTDLDIIGGGQIVIASGKTLVITGSFRCGCKQCFYGAGSVVFARNAVVNPYWFGAAGDGDTDDTAAIQKAVHAVELYGGVVYFPTPAIYKITGQITVTSDYAVNLVSEMGMDNEEGSSSAGYFAVGTSISGSMFKISSPGAKPRYLYFKDPTSVLGVSQGTRAITAAIEIDRLTGGKIEDCSFDGLLGSAIKTNNFIRGVIDFPHIRDCGTPTKPAIWLTGTSSKSCTQAVTVQHPRIEVCYGEYIYLDTYSYSNKILGGQFEADTSIEGSNKTYIYNKGSKNKFIGCGMNRNNGIHMYLYSDNALVDDCNFEAGSVTSVKLYLRGSNNVITGNKFNGNSTDTGTAINDVGGYNTFSGNRLYYCGNVILGPYSSWKGDCYNLKTTLGYAINASQANANITGSIVHSCGTVENPCGGIKLANNVVCEGNTIVNNTGIGLLVGATTCMPRNNRCSGNDGGDISCTHYPHGFSPDSNYAGDGAYPLYYSDTWDPGSLDPGVPTSVSVTLTGLAVGDFVSAAFPMLVSASAQAGMSISASAVAANTALVTVVNHNIGAINLDSGTLVVKGIKK